MRYGLYSWVNSLHFFFEAKCPNVQFKLFYFDDIGFEFLLASTLKFLFIFKSYFPLIR